VKYRLWVPLASLLPNWVLKRLIRRFPIHRDPADGWNFWLDASYAKYCRRDLRNRPESVDETEDEIREREYGAANDITWGA
jgi:hypothetical protein